MHKKASIWHIMISWKSFLQTSLFLQREESFCCLHEDYKLFLTLLIFISQQIFSLYFSFVLLRFSKLIFIFLILTP